MCGLDYALYTFMSLRVKRPTLIPRWHLPEWWFDYLGVGVEDCFDRLRQLIDPEVPLGFVFWGVYKLKAPKQVMVKL